MPVNSKFKCAMCGKEYDTIEGRAVCELACIRNREEEERKEAEAKRKADEQMRKQAVDDAFETAFRLKKKFIEDYGSYDQCCDECADTRCRHAIDLSLYDLLNMLP